MLEAGSCRRTQLVKESQTTLVALEYLWMCLSGEFIVSSSCFDKFVVKSNLSGYFFAMTDSAFFWKNCMKSSAVCFDDPVTLFVSSRRRILDNDCQSFVELPRSSTIRSAQYRFFSANSACLHWSEWREEGRTVFVGLGPSISSLQPAARTTSGPAFSVAPPWMWLNTTMHLMYLMQSGRWWYAARCCIRWTGRRLLVTETARRQDSCPWCNVWIHTHKMWKFVFQQW